MKDKKCSYLKEEKKTCRSSSKDNSLFYDELDFSYGCNVRLILMHDFTISTQCLASMYLGHAPKNPG